MFDFLSESRLSQQNGSSGTVTTRDWLKFMCLAFLNLIPIVGPIIYFVVLIYLMVDNQTADSLKGYLRASLILGVIAVGISIILMILCWAALYFGMFGSLGLANFLG